MTEDTVSHEEEIRPGKIGGTVKRDWAAARQAIHRITEHKRAEEERRENEEKYDRPPEPASDAVLTVTRPAGKIVDANAAAAEMLGYSLPELIGLLAPEISSRQRCLRRLNASGSAKCGRTAITVWRRSGYARMARASRSKPAENLLRWKADPSSTSWQAISGSARGGEGATGERRAAKGPI